jgi:UDP-N-acetylglucosamine 2-epimerase (non-hydrolysing)
MKALVLMGTRPECIKLAPVIRELSKTEHCEVRVCFTGQHKEMAKQVIDLFQLRIDWDLGLMTQDQTLADLSAKCLVSVDRVLAEWRPDWLVVQGDTTTAMIGALAGFYRDIRVAHVEAGLRTGDMYHPWPEEFNRRVIDLVAGAFFPPTEWAAKNLRREGVAESKILVCGNTGIDALLQVAAKEYDWQTSPISFLRDEEDIVLVTAHRRESFGGPFESLCQALKELAMLNPSTSFVYPVHLNPNVQGPVRSALDGLANLHLLPPVDYFALVQLLKKARLVLTDSGGIQEEAPSFGLPILVMRETTERPEAVDAGFALVVGTSKAKIVQAAQDVLSRSAKNGRIEGVNPYGDGNASARIAEFLLRI